jgi:hypothetical protein
MEERPGAKVPPIATRNTPSTPASTRKIAAFLFSLKNMIAPLVANYGSQGSVPRLQFIAEQNDVGGQAQTNDF